VIITDRDKTLKKLLLHQSVELPRAGDRIGNCVLSIDSKRRGQQFPDARFIVGCNVNPMILVGHVKVIVCPKVKIVSGGRAL